MRGFLFGVLGFLVGLVATTLAVFFSYVALTALTDYHDFEGATAMGMATIAPFTGLIGGAIGAALFVHWFGRKRPA
jgi:hypothetical protein